MEDALQHAPTPQIGGGLAILAHQATIAGAARAEELPHASEVTPDILEEVVAERGSGRGGDRGGSYADGLSGMPMYRGTPIEYNAPGDPPGTGRAQAIGTLLTKGRAPYRRYIE